MDKANNSGSRIDTPSDTSPTSSGDDQDKSSTARKPWGPHQVAKTDGKSHILPSDHASSGLHRTDPNTPSKRGDTNNREDIKPKVDKKSSILGTLKHFFLALTPIVTSFIVVAALGLSTAGTGGIIIAIGAGLSALYLLGVLVIKYMDRSSHETPETNEHISKLQKINEQLKDSDARSANMSFTQEVDNQGSGYLYASPQADKRIYQELSEVNNETQLKGTYQTLDKDKTKSQDSGIDNNSHLSTSDQSTQISDYNRDKVLPQKDKNARNIRNPVAVPQNNTQISQNDSPSSSPETQPSTNDLLNEALENSNSNIENTNEINDTIGSNKDDGNQDQLTGTYETLDNDNIKPKSSDINNNHLSTSDQSAQTSKGDLDKVLSQLEENSRNLKTPVVVPQKIHTQISQDESADTALGIQPSAYYLLNKALENFNFNIKDLDGMIDARNRNENNENIKKLLSDPELSSDDRAEDINKNLLDVLVKYRQKKLSADYLNINAEDYQEHQFLVANYIAQMNALIPDLQHLPKNEINNIKALCNYNADNILQNTSKISAEEFRDQLFTNISNNAKKGNISKDGRNMVINNFTKNKYFTPTDTAPRTQPSADNLLNKALEGSNFNIKDLDGMIDASNRNEKNENINKLLNNPELSSADRAEDINKNLLDVLVKHRQKKLSADYLNINAEDYQEHQLLVANYIAQMNALIPELQHLHKYEQNNIRAVFNYNADDILRKTTEISAEEFRDRLFTKITTNAKKENINKDSLDIVAQHFDQNKYFTPTDTAPRIQTSADNSPSSNPELVTNTKPTIRFATDNNPPKAEDTDIGLETQPSEDLEESSINDLLNDALESANFNIEELNSMIDDIDNKTDNVNINNLLNNPELSSADRPEDINQNLRDALVTYRQKKLSEAFLNINNDDYDAKSRIIFANYIAQMGDLTPKLQRLRKDELDNIQAICNYNANNILKDKENNLSNEEFKKQLISSITKDAKRGNIDEQNINIIIDAFNQNEYFDKSFKPPSKPKS